VSEVLAALIAASDSATRVILPKKDELIWGTIAFVLLFAFLAKAVFPKVREMLEQRTERVRGQLEAADRSKQEADQMLEQYRAQLADARGEVQRIIDEGKRTAEAVRQELVARAEQEAADIVSRARADVAGERDRAMQQLRTTVGELSLQLASRVIERELSSSEAHRALIDRAIQELSVSGGNGQVGGDGQAGGPTA
jgi:F-type H+-transporting ATPase subunit b